MMVSHICGWGGGYVLSAASSPRDSRAEEKNTTKETEDEIRRGLQQLWM